MEINHDFSCLVVICNECIIGPVQEKGFAGEVSPAPGWPYASRACVGLIKRFSLISLVKVYKGHQY